MRAARIIVTIPLSLLLGYPMTVHGRQVEPEQRVTWPLPALTGADELRLTGYQPTTTLRFMLPPNWQQVTAGALTVAYHVSPATLGAPAYRRERLAEPGPTLTIRLNGQAPISSTLVAEMGTQPFSLPIEQLQPGPNEITLSVFLPLKDDPQCLVADHPDRWFELEPGTQLALMLVPSSDPPKLTQYPWHFAPLGDQAPSPITFVVPDEPSDAELQALSSVAASLAGAASTQSDWQVLPESGFDPARLAGPAVLVGDANRNRHVAMVAPTGASADGWLHLSRPEWANGYPVLSVGGPNAQAVSDAAAALLNPTVVGEAAGPTVFVADPAAINPVQLGEVVTLAQLGYGQEMVKGTGLESITYTFERPLAWGARNGRFELRLSHSRELSWSPAPLAVYLNNQRVASVLFDAPEQSSSIVDIPLPAGLLQAGRNTLRLDFTLSVPEGRCGVDTLEGFWASVDPQSRLELPRGGWSGYIDLQHTPFQFVSDVDLADLGIVLPAKGTLRDLANALELVRVLDQAPSVAAPRLIRPESAEQNVRQLHLIVLGEVARQPVLHELNPYLRAPFDLATGTLIETNGIHVPVAQPNAAVVQTLRSPWASNRGILVATGDTERSAAAALELLTEPETWAGVTGNVAVASVTSDGLAGQIVAQRVANIDAVPGLRSVDRVLRRFLGNNSKWAALGVPAFAMLLVALGSVLGLRWDRRRRAHQAGGH